MANVRISHEGKRGCGFRKGGGKYLVSGALQTPCGKLPIPLTVCPTCGVGIKPSRGWTWIDGAQILGDKLCRVEGTHKCVSCPLNTQFKSSGGAVFGKVGLLWVGEQYYKDPEAFAREAREVGISRRINAVPRDFKLSETWVWLAHRKAICREACAACKGAGSIPMFGDEKPDKTKHGKCHECNGEGVIYVAAVFNVFRPTAIEYIIKGDETEDELNLLEKQGLSLVKVERVGEQAELNLPEN